MNPLINEAAGTVQGAWIMGVMTVVFLMTFLYWFWYAYAPSHKERMEAAGRMPFEEEATPLSEGGEE